MKYIREFKIFGKEIVWEFKPKIGEYVVVSSYILKNDNSDTSRPHPIKTKIENFCKITSIPTSTNSTYYGEMVDGKIKIFFKDDIIRKMTSEEIETFEIESNAKRYNV